MTEKKIPSGEEERNTISSPESEQSNKEADSQGMPTVEQLQHALDEENYKVRYRHTMRNIIFLLVTAAAAAVLIATLLLPVFRIYGSSMTPTLQEGEMTVAVKQENLKQGDLVAFYYNNKILVKRVIATAGQWVNIDSNGNVYVDGELLDEPYVQGKSLGECDIDLPYQVPDERIFVMGDHRNVSMDSRLSAIGCVSQDQIAGKLVFRIWPLNRLGKI